MKKVFLLIAILAMSIMAIQVVSLSPAFAKDPLEIKEFDGSTEVQTTHYKGRRGFPIRATLKMPHSFFPGVPVKARLSLKFWNAPMSVRIKGVVKKRYTYQYFHKAFIRPGAIWFTQSCHPPEGTSSVSNYGGLCEGSRYMPGFHDIDLTYDGRIETKRFDVAQPYFDWSYGAKKLKPRWLKKNQVARYTVWVSFPRCLTLDTSILTIRPANNWPCEPASINIGTWFNLRGKKGWSFDSVVAFYSFSSMYIHP